MTDHRVYTYTALLTTVMSILYVPICYLCTQPSCDIPHHHASNCVHDCHCVYTVQMLLTPNTLCCSLYKHNCICAVTKFFTHKIFFPNFCG